MDNAEGKRESQKNSKPSVKPSSLIYFINGELIRVVHTSRANNICVLYNYIQDKEQTMLLSDFKKHRKRAYTVINTTRIFGRSRMQFERMMSSGIIPYPTGASQGGKRKFRTMSYYSEDDLFIIREAMSKIHMGRPRKDGRVTPRRDVPTEKDLRSLLGDAIMLYTKTEDGRFIPVWQEETW